MRGPQVLEVDVKDNKRNQCTEEGIKSIFITPWLHRYICTTIILLILLVLYLHSR